MSALVERYSTATRLSLLEQARNRTALFLLALFVPAWFVLMRVIVPDDSTEFHLRATGELISVNGFHLTLITAGLNALTLIVGFMLFSAVRRDIGFDRRLARCGFPRTLLLLARFSVLLAVSLAVSVYAVAIFFGFWRPGFGVAAILLGFVLASLIYGALGVFVGLVVRGELEGFFIIIMVSMIDTFLQNPIGNPAADKPLITYFPTYGVMQFSVAGSFAGEVQWLYAGLAALWVAGFTLAALLAFWLATRAPNVRLGKQSAGGTARPAATQSAD